MCYGLGKRAPLESSAGPARYKDSVIFFHFIVFLFVCALFSQYLPTFFLSGTVLTPYVIHLLALLLGFV